jgi:hypothetical protein
MLLDRRQLAWVAAAALACVGAAFVCAPRSGLPHLTPPDCVFERMVTGRVCDEGAISAGGTMPGTHIGLSASGEKGRTHKEAGRPEWAIPFGDEFWRRSSRIRSDAIARDDSGVVISPVQVSDTVERVNHAFRQEDANSLPKVRGRGYQASVTDGLEFVASSPEAGEPATAARFYTRSIRREIGEGSEAQPVCPAWFVAGNTAQALLNAASGLVEHCEAGPAGVEVTWVMNRPPPGQGGMVIEAEMTGIRFSRQSPSGLHFVDGSGIERVKVGLAKAVDRKGRTWPVSIECRGTLLRAVVPDEALAQAEFPLAIDPLISAEFGMDQPLAGPAPCTRAAPLIAANDSGYLVVWTHGNGTATAAAVYAAHLSLAGEPLDPFGILVSGVAAEQTVCAAAAGPGAFLVVWSAPHGTSVSDWDIYGARIQADGTVIDARPLTVCGMAGTVQSSPAVAGNGDDYLVVWRDSRSTGIYGSVVSADGTVSPTNGFPICVAANDQYTPAVAALGTNYLVAWQDYRNGSLNYHSDIYAARVTGNGVLLDTNGIAVCTGTNSNDHPAVASNGTNFLVVWEGYDVGGNDILGARVGPNGLVLDTNGFVISHAANAQVNPAAAPIGGDFLIVWQDYRGSPTNDYEATIYGARVRGDGSIADPDGVALSPALGEKGTAAVGTHGSDAIAVWQDFRTNPSSTLADIYGAPVSALSNLVAAPDFEVSTVANMESSPSSAANGTNFLVVWADNRNAPVTAADIYGLRLDQAGGFIDAVPFPICAATNDQAHPAVATQGGNWLVVWSDWRLSTNSTHSDIFGSLVSPAGLVLQPEGIPICTAVNDQDLPAAAALGTNFLVVWQDARRTSPTATQIDIYGARVSGNGNVLDAAAFPICRNSGQQTWPAIAANDTQALVVWTGGRSGATVNQVRFARVATDGTVLDINGIPICSTSAPQTTPAVVANGQGYFVVWADWRASAVNAPDIYGAWVGTNGAVSPAGGLPIRVGVGIQTTPTVAFNGLDYLVAWQEALAGFTNLFSIAGTRVGSDGTVSAGLLLNIASAGTCYSAPVVRVGPDGRFLVVSQRAQFGSARTVANLVDLQAIPRLDAPAWLPNGQFQFLVHGTVGERYAIQASDALTNWIPIGTITNIVNPAPFADPAASQPPRRFYRALLLP